MSAKTLSLAIQMLRSVENSLYFVPELTCMADAEGQQVWSGCEVSRCLLVVFHQMQTPGPHSRARKRVVCASGHQSWCVGHAENSGDEFERNRGINDRVQIVTTIKS